MGKKLRIVLVVLLIVLPSVLMWQVLRPREPEPIYQGKPLSFWLKGYDSGNYPGTNTALAPTRQEAETALRHLGSNALPVLLGMLRTPDSPFRDMLFGLARQQRFFKIKPPMPSATQHNVALWGLCTLGVNASNALPQLMDIYERSPNHLSQQIIPAVLSGIGPPAKVAIPLLIRGTANTNDNVRMNSVYALGQIQAEPDLVVPVLIKCLHDASPPFRANAARSLAAFGNGARPAAPALLALLKEEQAKATGVAGTRELYNWSVGDSPPGSFSGSSAPLDVAGIVLDALRSIDPEAAARVGRE
ncbi:MAG: repeat protein [Pedosphaera sp.]|nr:repeat protein [Pedosphaera sp.]